MKPTLLRMREGKPGGGKGPLLSEDLSLTLTGTQDVLFQPQPIAFGTSDLDNPRNDGTTPPLMAKLNGQRTGSGPTVYAAIPPSLTPRSSAASAVLTSASNEPDGGPSASARSTPMPAPSSPSDGPESRTSVTSWAFDRYNNALTPESPTLPSSFEGGFNHVMAVTGPTPPSGRAGSPAKISASPASAEGSQESAAASPSPSSTLWSDTDLKQSSWRTFQASSAAMPAKTLGRSSVSWGNSAMGGPSGFWTRNGPECLKDEEGCSSSPSTLSDILMSQAPDRFSLSARAAAGIIRRSEKRGRSLPDELAEALASLARLSAPSGPSEAADQPETSTTTSSWTVRRLTPTECERLMGWPDGWTVVDGWTRGANKQQQSLSSITPGLAQRQSTRQGEMITPESEEAAGSTPATWQPSTPSASTRIDTGPQGMASWRR